MKTAYHESAKLHVTGEAVYIDDMKNFPKILFGTAFTSPVAHGELIDFDLEEAKKLKGVYTILSYKDIPGHNRIGAIVHDEPVLVEKEISYAGQALFLIAAKDRKTAEKAIKAIKVNIKEKKPILTVEESQAAGLQLDAIREIERGNPEKAFDYAPHKIESIFINNGQEHWYLETHASICVPGEYNEMKVYCSTQNPSEVQMLIAKVLGVNMNDIEVETRRLGGAFGGKEAQAGTFAVWAALLAKATNKPVKVRLDRHTDQSITGKRHPFVTKYKVGFDENGKILAAIIDQNSNAGAFADLSMAILERAMLHAENAYYIPNIRITGTAWKTNLPPNTAFRGFGGPQGIAVIDNIIRQIAAYLKKDPLEIQQINFYKDAPENITPYGQKVEDNRLQIILNKLLKTAEYHKRREEIKKFNSNNKFKKRGLDLMPVKFGISFTSSFLNQAGALVNIYTDGTVLVNHGGIEMGQGLYTKIRQIAAAELGVPLDKIKVNATNTSKVPNTSPTAASTGADMNGMAVKIAIDKLKKRIAETIAEYFTEKTGQKTSAENIIFENFEIYDKLNPKNKLTFDEAMQIVRFKRVSLSATGFYRTPGVYFDREKGVGEPFYYFAFGMALTEVEVDLLTGEVKVLRTDILHDVGDSLNPEIDKGQVEGAFVQGMGWVLSEDLKYTDKGILLTNSPDTYKIPTINDIPEIFNVNLLEGYANAKNTIRRSKAVGEPPFILGISAFFAVKDALWSITDYKIEPQISIPATNEYIVSEAERLLKLNK